MKRSSLLLAVGLCLALAGEGHTTQIHFQPVGLVELTRTAPFVVVGRYHRGPDEPTRGMLFAARGAMSSEAQGIGNGEPLHVWQASAAAWGRTRTAGGHRSPMVPSLEGAPPLVDGHDYILFLAPGAKAGEYVTAAENGYVPVERLDECRAAQRSWVGHAANAKGGAVVVMGYDPPSPVYIDQLGQWPPGVEGQNVAVTGVVVSAAYLPAADSGPAIGAGSSGHQWVMRHPMWVVVPPPTLETFRRIEPGMTLGDIYNLVGPARDIGSGIYILVYNLADGSTVRVLYSGPGRVKVQHVHVDGTCDVLLPRR